MKKYFKFGFIFPTTPVILLPILLLATINISAQNLISNPGFEKYVKIPCNCIQEDLSSYLTDWENAGAGSADYIHNGSSETCYANPTSSHWDSYGYEQPHGGEAMAMIMTMGEDRTYREYLSMPLKTPLKKSKEYYVEFYVSLGDYCGLATNNIGLLFSMDKPKYGSDFIINGTPQINCEQIVVQTDGWVKVSGNFVADNNFRYITIGNFAPNSLTELTVRSKETFSGNHTYRKGAAAYYVDDFVLKEINPDVLTLKGDTVVQQGGISTLVAEGAKKYQWADAKSPDKIIGHGPEFNSYIQNTTTFLVYTDIDTATITVSVPTADVAQLDGREVAEKCIVEIFSDEIQIEVFDKSYVDGDILSLYNGSFLIAQHVQLDKNKKSFSIHIDRSKATQIIVYAENVGQYAPNTACVIVKDGLNETEIMLESDFSSSESVVLNYVGGK